jgi:hypothetical protein
MRQSNVSRSRLLISIACISITQSQNRDSGWVFWTWQVPHYHRWASSLENLEILLLDSCKHIRDCGLEALRHFSNLHVSFTCVTPEGILSNLPSTLIVMHNPRMQRNCFQTQRNTLFVDSSKSCLLYLISLLLWRFSNYKCCHTIYLYPSAYNFFVSI